MSDEIPIEIHNIPGPTIIEVRLPCKRAGRLSAIFSANTKFRISRNIQNYLKASKRSSPMVRAERFGVN